MAEKIQVLPSSLSPDLFINTASGRKEQQRKKEASSLAETDDVERSVRMPRRFVRERDDMTYLIVRDERWCAFLCGFLEYSGN